MFSFPICKKNVWDYFSSISSSSHHSLLTPYHPIIPPSLLLSLLPFHIFICLSKLFYKCFVYYKVLCILLPLFLLLLLMLLFKFITLPFTLVMNHGSLNFQSVFFYTFVKYFQNLPDNPKIVRSLLGEKRWYWSTSGWKLCEETRFIVFPFGSSLSLRE